MKRTELLAGVMQKIGMPLLLSMIEVNPDKSLDENVSDISNLLGSTLITSETITRSLQVTEEEEDLDYLFRSTGYASQIMATWYRKTGKLPSEKDIKRTVSSTTALLAFSEHYKPGETPEIEGSELSDLLKKKLETNVDIRFLTIFMPLADAIGSFSFGQPQNKLIQDVSEKLYDYAFDCRKRIMGDLLSEKSKKDAEIIILESLSSIFLSCYNSELKRVEGLSEKQKAEEKNETQIENIWNAFRERMLILTNFTGYVLEESEGSFVPDNIVIDKNQKDEDDIFEILANAENYESDVDFDTLLEEITGTKEILSENKTTDNGDETTDDGGSQKGNSSGSKSTTPMSFYSADKGQADAAKTNIPKKKENTGPMAFYKKSDEKA